jgi:hypothetical protein
MNRPELLAIYLNDHLAGSIGGVETARRVRGSNEGTEFGAPLAALCSEIESDRETLEAVMEELGVSRSRIKPTIGWLGEKVGRLKRHRATRPRRRRRSSHLLHPSLPSRRSRYPAAAAGIKSDPHDAEVCRVADSGYHPRGGGHPQ